MDRNLFIKSRLIKHFDAACALGYEVVGVWLQGSQNYGLDEYSDEYCSDVDTKCIVIPTLNNLIKEEPEISFVHVLENEEHVDIKDIRKVFNLFKKQNIQYLELLYSDFYIINPKYFTLVQKLLANADNIIKINYNQVLRTTVGMSLEKLKALEHPYPATINKIERFGYDPKQLHHIIRLYDFIQKYIAGCSFKECLKPSDATYLMQVKKGYHSLEEAKDLAFEYYKKTQELKQANLKSEELVDIASMNFLDDLKVDFIKTAIYSEINK